MRVPNSRRSRRAVNRRDAVRRRKGALGAGHVRVTLRALRVGRSIDVSAIAESVLPDSDEPCCCLPRVSGANDGNAELIDCEEQPAHSVPRERAVIDRSAFDDEVAPWRAMAYTRQLLPQAPADQRRVEIGDGLPLDDRRVRERIVTRAELRDPDRRAQRDERARDTRRLLVDVDVDQHRRSVARRVPLPCAQPAPTLTTSDFAGP